MKIPEIFESEYRFCLIMWEHQPVGSRKLVKLAQEKFGWAPTTTYTVIKRLSLRGILVNENSVVRALISKEQVQESRIGDMVEKTFEGSAPAFVAAFTKSAKLSGEEIDAIQRMIDDYRKEEK